MNLDERLKQLKELPQDAIAKAKIYHEITTPKEKARFNWREPVVIVGFMMILLFLLINPQSDSNSEQSATTDIRAIYLYPNGEPGQFFARPSTLFLGVERGESEEIYNLFSDLERYLVKAEALEQGDNYPSDVVVVTNNGEKRYQAGFYGVQDIDSGQFYVPKDDEYLQIYFNFTKYEPQYYFFIIILLLNAGNLISHYYCKRRNIPQVKMKGKDYWLMGLGLASLLSLFYYQLNIGPLYKPFLYGFVAIYCWLIWRLMKQKHTTLIGLRVEKYRVICTFALFIIMIYSL